MELYVHIPFCRQKCRYCSFTSYVGQETFFEEYIELLLKEASLRVKEAEMPIRTVYIGGGTPSLLPPVLFSRLLNGLHHIFHLDSVTEFTSEANPGTVTEDWLSAAADGGVNRLSLGMQALQKSHLLTLGRIHQMDDVIHSVLLCRQSGIRNISVDLIFGIPGQSIYDWSDSLDAVIALTPNHISAYGLIPEEGTPLYDDLKNCFLHLPDPDVERQMYTIAVSTLKAKGYSRYEISNFAVNGFECEHNLGYWNQVPYIGLGISAASMTRVRFSAEGMTYYRRTNPESIKEYCRMLIHDSSAYPEELIGPAESRFETLMLGFRTEKGISEFEFYRKHGCTLDSVYGNKLFRLEKSGLLNHIDGFWKMTERGFDIQNAVLVELMD